MTTIQDLLQELQFRIIDGNAAYGDVDGCTVKLVIIGYEPVSLLLGFLVGADPQHTQVTLSQEALPSAEKVELSLDDGIVWLSLFKLNETSSAALVASIKRIVAELKSAEFAIDASCSKCGAADTPVTLQGNQPVRICLACIEQERQRLIELNRPGLSTLYWLPVSIVATATSWATVWSILDLYVDWLQAGRPVRGFEVNEITLMPILGCAVLLFCIGYGLGGMIPTANMGRNFAITVSIFVSVAAMAVGEVLYIAFDIFKHLGVFDVLLAFQILLPWVQSYSAGWIVFKILLGGSFLVGCVARARAAVIK